MPHIPLPNVYVSIEDLPNLKRQYKKALKNNKTSFKAYLVCGEQGEFLTTYAKYLIEHLTNLKNAKNLSR